MNIVLIRKLAQTILDYIAGLQEFCSYYEFCTSSLCKLC